MTPEYEAIISGIESAAARRAVGDHHRIVFGLAPRPGEWSVGNGHAHARVSGRTWTTWSPRPSRWTRIQAANSPG